VERGAGVSVASEPILSPLDREVVFGSVSACFSANTVSRFCIQSKNRLIFGVRQSAEDCSSHSLSFA
jgi:hypothetical protein